MSLRGWLELRKWLRASLKDLSSALQKPCLKAREGAGEMVRWLRALYCYWQRSRVQIPAPMLDITRFTLTVKSSPRRAHCLWPLPPMGTCARVCTSMHRHMVKNTHVKKPNEVLCTCNPDITEAEAGGCLEAHSPANFPLHWQSHS